MTHGLRWLIAGVLALGAPLPATAHGLVVFATVEDDEVLVDAKFANGQAVLDGEVRVLDAAGQEVRRFAITPDAPIRFPLGEAVDGLQIEVTSGDHENYWILTPADIAAGGEGAELTQ